MKVPEGPTFPKSFPNPFFKKEKTDPRSHGDAGKLKAKKRKVSLSGLGHLFPEEGTSVLDRLTAMVVDDPKVDRASTKQDNTRVEGIIGDYVDMFSHDDSDLLEEVARGKYERIEQDHNAADLAAIGEGHSKEERWELMSIAASQELAKRSRKQDKENAIFGKKNKDR